jgi:hypothetical protein
MSQITTSILTLISLVGHVFLGCCAHHAHAARAAAVVVTTAQERPRTHDAPRASAEEAHACGCRSHRGSRPRQCDEPANGCGSHEHDDAACDGQVCQYLGPDVVKVPDASPSAMADTLVPAEDPAAAAGSASLRECVDSDASAAGFRDGARIHKLMAVWLL